MRKIKLALSLIVIGLIMFVLVMTFNGWNFKNLSKQEYVMNTYEITEDFESIIIDVTTADVKILPSTDNQCKIEIYEDKSNPHKAEATNKTLTIEKQKSKNFSIFNFESSKITVYLPNQQYKSLLIEVTTGDIDLDTVNVESLDFYVTTGDVSVKNVNCSETVIINSNTGKTDLTNINCKNLKANGTTNNAILNNIIAIEKLEIRITTGDVTLNNCDAAEIYIKVTTGNVSGNLLTGKIFDVQTTTGNKNVPATTGGMCKIEATTGDISITVSQSE